MSLLRGVVRIPFQTTFDELGKGNFNEVADAEVRPTTFKSLLLFGNLQVPISKAVVLQNDFPPSHRTIFYPPIRKLEELFSLLEKDLMLI